MNGHIEQHLRAYVNFAQSDWVQYLSSAEFALNNHDTHVTGVSPFLAVYGQNQRSGSDLSVTLAGPPVPASLKFDRLDAKTLVEKMITINKFIVDNIKYHTAEYEEQANKKRTANHSYYLGDLVLLNYKNLRLLRPCRK